MAQTEPEPVASDQPEIETGSSALYGRIMNNSKKGIDAASVQLFSIRSNGDSLLRGMLSKPNGEFRFQKLPVADSFRVVISALGFSSWQQVIGADTNSTRPNLFEKDLGNIILQPEVKQLGAVVVTSSRPALEMGIDRKIFNVSKSLLATGGSALDIMKNIPSVSVDIDGNIELRNSTPQIFVDGQPTILTLDQIPADHIDKIELITNPSAKFDAASSAGIINVVLKKNKRVGLNGVASVGAGTPGVFNSNLSLNLRQGKFNFFASGGHNRYGGIAEGKTLRENKTNGIVTDYSNQFTENKRRRRYTSLRFGADFFLNNRNTITLSQDFFRGKSGNDETQDQEYLNAARELQYYGIRNTAGDGLFTRRSTRLHYRHNFPKEGKELTADISYNYGKNTNRSEISNYYYLPNDGEYQPPAFVNNDGGGNSEQWTFQSDYANPISEKIKIETGVRSFQNFSRNFYNAFANENGQQVKLPLSNNYKYKEMVNAGYFTFSYKQQPYSFQVGLRAEHSRFTGELIDSSYKFGYEYPNKISRIWDALFPSLFVTRQIGEDQELQVNYTRRIRRPRFWQLNPFIDINDPTNLQQGNPGLRPEFINSFELNYSNDFNKGNLLGVLYFRNNPGDITQYSDTITAAQYQQLGNAAIDPNAILNTFINASTTNRYGAELTVQYKPVKNFDITPTVNFQYRTVNAKVNDLNLSNKGFNWEAKLNVSYKIETPGKSIFNNLGFQLSSEYESPRVIPQGRRIAQYVTDAAIRKDFWKEKASLTFAVNDVFDTRRYGTIYDTDDFYQDSYRRWSVRNFRLTFSIKFGDANFSLSRKANTGERGED